jgi:hypothetical protein
VKRTVAPPPPPPPRPAAAARPPPQPAASAGLRRQSRVSRRPPVAGGKVLPPAPEFAPRLPSTPRMSAIDFAPTPMPAMPASFGDENVADPKFPSFTMGSDFFDGHDGEDGFAEDITNVAVGPRGASCGKGEVGSGYSMPTPWDKPLDPDMLSEAPVLSVRTSGGGGGYGGGETEDDDEDGEDLFDIPTRLTLGPGAAAARLDLQRCTIRVHKQLVNQLQTHSMKPGTFDGFGDGKNDSGDDDLSRAQGEVWLRSRVPMRGWRRRYGSIVDHAYFGPVLFLFKYDSKNNVALHHSMMIVLVDSQVRLGRNSTTKDGYRCEFLLKTTKRKYQIAANHTMRRDYWIRNLEHIQKTAASRA